MTEYITKSEAETRKLGSDFAKKLSPGSIVALIGDLGCGKTAFVKGAADFFGCTEPVTSPTFTLVNQYDGDITLYHFDVYRLEHPTLDECDWIDDYLFGDGICFIEWADNISEILPENTVRVSFKKSTNQVNHPNQINAADNTNIRYITIDL